MCAPTTSNRMHREQGVGDSARWGGGNLWQGWEKLVGRTGDWDVVSFALDSDGHGDFFLIIVLLNGQKLFFGGEGKHGAAVERLLVLPGHARALRAEPSVPHLFLRLRSETRRARSAERSVSPGFARTAARAWPSGTAHGSARTEAAAAMIARCAGGRGEDGAQRAQRRPVARDARGAGGGQRKGLGGQAQRQGARTPTTTTTTKNESIDANGEKGGTAGPPGKRLRTPTPPSPTTKTALHRTLHRTASTESRFFTHAAGLEASVAVEASAKFRLVLRRGPRAARRQKRAGGGCVSGHAFP